MSNDIAQEQEKNKNFFSFFKKIIYSFKFIPPKEKIALIILAAIFSTSFFALILQLNSLYFVKVPDFGGKINEGVIGVPRFINPLLATSDADRDLVQLIYSGLLTIDGKRNLKPSLALKYEISKDGLAYTFYINPKAKWHDGKSLDADDVIFTIKEVKDSGLNSSKRANWEGVEVQKVDKYTVRFLLKIPYSSFLENMMLPIIPKHIWSAVTSEEMSLSNFNLEPIGSGPYKVKKIYRNSAGIITLYKLIANKEFVLGKPFIKEIDLSFFSSEEKLIEALRNRKIDSSGFVSSSNINRVLRNGIILKELTLPRIFGVFFNSQNNPIFEEKEVRMALNAAVDRKYIIDQVLSGHGVAIDSPIPPGSIGALPFNENNLNQDQKVSEAKKILESKGWKLNKDGVFEKKVKKKILKLEINLSTSNLGDLSQTADILKNMWEKIGARVNIKEYEIGDLNQIVLKKKNYEALLFGEVVGIEPEPFAFWHSSQRNDPGLNIALYANPNVDKVLEDARKELDAKERMKKYQIFQKEVKNDQAAVFLYSPYFVYLFPSFINGLNIESISIPSERFALVEERYIYSRNVWPIFLKN